MRRVSVVGGVINEATGARCTLVGSAREGPALAY